MEELADALKRVHADSFNMYYKAHSYHWNVTGSDFPQLHEFFGMIYNEVWTAIDPIAEHIRTLDEYAPRGLDRIMNLTSIDFDSDIPNSIQMINNLLVANQKVLAKLYIAHGVAEAQNKRGIVNFLEDRIDTHEKHGWQLRSILRK